MFSRRPLATSVFVLFALTATPAVAQSLIVTRLMPTVATPDEEVDIYGEGFGKGTRVFLGEHALAVRVLSPTHLRVTVPAGARSGELVVRSRGRVARSEVLEIVRFHESPVIDSVSPQVVKTGGLLRIKGRGFGEANRTIYVSVGGAAAEVVERTREMLIVRVPNEASSGSVIVVVARGGQAIAATPLKVDSSKVVRREARGAAKPSAAR
jgi:hypothetical protein